MCVQVVGFNRCDVCRGGFSEQFITLSYLHSVYLESLL